MAPAGCIVISGDWQPNQVCGSAGGCWLGLARLGAPRLSDLFKGNASQRMISWLTGTADIWKGHRWAQRREARFKALQKKRQKKAKVGRRAECVSAGRWNAFLLLLIVSNRAQAESWISSWTLWPTLTVSIQCVSQWMAWMCCACEWLQWKAVHCGVLFMSYVLSGSRGRQRGTEWDHPHNSWRKHACTPSERFVRNHIRMNQSRGSRAVRDTQQALRPMMTSYSRK